MVATSLNTGRGALLSIGDFTNGAYTCHFIFGHHHPHAVRCRFDLSSTQYIFIGIAWKRKQKRSVTGK